MNKASVFLAILALVACVSALQQPTLVKASALECEGMLNYVLVVFDFLS